MAIWHCEGFICANVGITDSDTMYFNSQGEREAWFKGKQKFSFTEYSIIREGDMSKNGYNVGCAHVSQKFNDVLNCDYIMYKNTDLGNRWYYGRIMDREYVNPNSTRLYFDIDFYSTYADVIKFGTSFVFRHHCKKNDDWDGEYFNVKKIGLNVEPLNSTSIDSFFLPSDYNNMVSFNRAIRPNANKFYLIGSTDDAGNYTGLQTFTVNGTVPQVDIALGVIEKDLSLSGLISSIEDYMGNIINAMGWLKPGDSFAIMDTSTMTNISQIGILPAATSVGTNVDIYKIKKSDAIFDEAPKNGKTLSCLHIHKALICLTGERIDLTDLDYPDNNFIRLSFSLVNAQQPTGVISLSTRSGFNATKMFKLPPYPTFTLTADAKTEWANTQGITAAGQFIGGAIKFVGGAAMMGASKGTTGMGEVLAGVTDAINSAASALQAQFGTNQVISRANDSSLWQIENGSSVSIVDCVVNAPALSDIHSVDDYYTYFGYNVSKMMQPLQPDIINSRKIVFVQGTPALLGSAATFKGNEQLISQMNQGLRFWNGSNGISNIGDDVGDN